MTVPTDTPRRPERGYNAPRRRSRGPAAPRTLRDLRLAAGLSLRELEVRCRISRATISQIERGRLVATRAEADALAWALGLEGEFVTRPLLVYEHVTHRERGA